MIENDISLFTIENIKNLYNKKEYRFYDNEKTPFDLNIIGVRNDDSIYQHDKFDDTLIVLYNNAKGGYAIDYFDITTDPSTEYLFVKPINKYGTAILKQGQYRSLWRKGLHQGKFEALTQINPCTVVRDFNKDKNLDFIVPDYTYNKTQRLPDGSTLHEYYKDDKLVFLEQSGLFGINLHRAAKNAITNNIGFHSAGCQVFKDSRDNDRFLDMYINEALKYFPNFFTYTLFLKSDFRNL